MDPDTILTALLDRMIPMISGPEELDRVRSILDERGGEFCGCVRLDPEMVAATCAHGFLPMSEDFTGREILLVKTHAERCALDPVDLHVSRRTRRQADPYVLRIDVDFQRCLAAIVAYHSERWLTGRLNRVLASLHATPVAGVATHSVELYRGTELVAGEIGYTCGAVYTSMAGYHTESGSGKVQLVTLGRILHGSGFRLWDLGMVIPYKVSLGASVVKREVFLSRYHEACAVPTPSLPAEVRCAEVLR